MSTAKLDHPARPRRQATQHATKAVPAFKSEAEERAFWEVGAPYGMTRRFWQAPDQSPCITPPWGTLTAVNYDEGRIVWSVPLGSWPLPHRLPEKYGAINLAGPMVTAGGLVFEGSTLDNYIRAFDARNGRLLWKARLPYSAPATPMTYLGSDGRQYVVIAAGGHPKMPLPRGDAIVGFALPRSP